MSRSMSVNNFYDHDEFVEEKMREFDLKFPATEAFEGLNFGSYEETSDAVKDFMLEFAHAFADRKCADKTIATCLCGKPITPEKQKQIEDEWNKAVESGEIKMPQEQTTCQKHNQDSRKCDECLPQETIDEWAEFKERFEESRYYESIKSFISEHYVKKSMLLNKLKREKIEPSKTSWERGYNSALKEILKLIE